MDEQNSIPTDPLPTPTPPTPVPTPALVPVPQKNAGFETFFGILTGIIQPIAMGTLTSRLPPAILLIPFATIIIIFLPLILEVIFLNKKYPYFIKGVVIGTILIPLIGLGLCFLMLGAFSTAGH
jgi:hypothetical protein